MKDKKFFIDLIEEGISLYWEVLGKARNMKIFKEDIEWVISDDRKGPERIFKVNISSVNINSRIEKIIEDMQKRIIPDTIIINDNSTPKNIIDIFEKKGFDIDSSSPCMVSDISKIDNSLLKTLSSIKINKISNEEDLLEWVKIVNNEYFVMNYNQFLDIFSFSNTDFFIAYYNNKPAGICFTIKGEYNGTKFAVLEMVNTLSIFQRKGIGKEMLKYVFEYLKTYDCKYITLRSSEEGLNLYKKFNFIEYCKRTLITYNEEKIRRKYKIEGIKEFVNEILERENAEELLCGNEVLLSNDKNNCAKWFRNFIKKLNEEALLNAAQVMYLYCPCQISEEKIDKTKDLYSDSKSIKEFIDKMNLKKVIGKKIWYDEIKKSVYITKLYPHECGIEVNNASSIKEKRCHCDLINASNDLLPVEYCYCAAKFYYPLFSSVFGSKIEIEPLETVLNGGNKCTFKISNLGGNLL